MLSLKKKLQEQQRRGINSDDSSVSSASSSSSFQQHRHAHLSVSLRDRLLVREVQELNTHLPSTCQVHFPDPDHLHTFVLTVRPNEGAWSGGLFLFDVSVGAEYNLTPPTVVCRTRLWHPNIGEDGAVCLSLLRERSVDGYGWSPSRQLKDVVWGVNSLFTDLLNFDDPLNTDAADQHARSPAEFKRKVCEYVRLYASGGGSSSGGGTPGVS